MRYLLAMPGNQHRPLRYRSSPASYLAVVERSELHSRTLACTSGEGTTFTFTLPAMGLTAVTPAPPRQARPTRAPNAVKASRSKRSNANSGRQNNIEELAVTTQV